MNTIILDLIKSHRKFLIIFLALFYLVNISDISAQQPQPTVPPTPKPKETIIISPTPKTTTKVSVRTDVTISSTNTKGQPAEKFISVEPRINISLCVTNGNVKINGWDRSEVRAFVNNGSEVGFKIAEKNPQSGKPVWIFILGFDPQKDSQAKREECLSGEDIEIDVPRDAVVTLKGKDSRVSVESVRKARIENLSGSIIFSNIAEGITAKTYGGGIMVENSSGTMNLSSASGNIVVFDVRQSESGDSFIAKTSSGTITLQSVEHRQIETGTISGSTNFKGSLVNGGQYLFGTEKGAITLSLPVDSACKMNAWYGFGVFNSELPMQNAKKSEQSVSGQLGTDESNCSVNFKSSSGAIRIKKQE